MNVVSRMIKDYSERNSDLLPGDSEFVSGQTASKREWLSFHHVRYAVTGVLLVSILSLTFIQLGNNQDSSATQQLQLVTDNPERDKAKEVSQKTEALAPERVADKIAAVVEAKPPEVVKEITRDRIEEKVVHVNKLAIKVVDKAQPYKAKQKESFVTTKQNIEVPTRAAKRITLSKPVDKPVVVAQKVEKPKRASPIVKTKRQAEADPETDQGQIEKIARKPTEIQLAQKSYVAGIKLLKKRQLDRAAKFLADALEKNPQHIGAREALSGIYIRKKQFDKLNRLLTEGLEQNPGYFKFRQLLVQLYIDKNEDEKALEIIKDAKDQQKETARYHSLVAVIQQKLGRYEMAIESYQRALEVQPAESRWWLGLGLAFESNKQFNEAEKAYLRAYQIGNTSEEIKQFLKRRLAAVKLRTASAD